MTDKVFQKISKAISENLCEMMEMTFGELDEDGIFSDEERINRFMYGNEYLCILCGEKIIFNSGVTMNWWQVVGSRVADMYKKLKDKTKAYTFDEFATGLLVELMVLFADDYMDIYYLCDYEENHKYFVPIDNMLDYKYVNPKDIDFKKSRENNYEDLIYKGFIMEERFSFPLEQDVQDKLHLMAEIQWESIVDDGYHEEDDTVEVKDPITGEVSNKRYRDLFCECYKFLSNLSIYDKTSYYAKAMEIYEGEEEDFAELFGLSREDTPIVHNSYLLDTNFCCARKK